MHIYIHTYIHTQGDISKLHTILDNFTKSGLEPDTHFYNAVLNAYEKLADIEQVEIVFEKMKVCTYCVCVRICVYVYVYHMYVYIYIYIYIYYTFLQCGYKYICEIGRLKQVEIAFEKMKVCMCAYTIIYVCVCMHVYMSLFTMP
jgi:hypothetical protein